MLEVEFSELLLFVKTLIGCVETEFCLGSLDALYPVDEAQGPEDSKRRAPEPTWGSGKMSGGKLCMS